MQDIFPGTCSAGVLIVQDASVRSIKVVIVVCKKWLVRTLCSGTGRDRYRKSQLAICWCQEDPTYVAKHSAACNNWNFT